MNIFSILGLVGGLAFFLFGMNIMGQGLEKISGGKLEKILEKMTDSTLKGLLLGAAVTAVIQSSSATTVMVVGFVNSGIMKLRQAAGIIMGANMGTTITAWILSLTGIEGDSVFIQLLKPANFSPIFAIVGAVMILFLKDSKKKTLGTILIGFAILMTGMDAMSDAVAPLADVPEFTGILTMFNNPLFGILAGALLTAIVQSSSASVGILQALTVTGSINYSIAIPIVMGQNIGTCITAVISTIGANKNAKRAGFIHLYFNIIGAAVLYIIYYLIKTFFNLDFFNDTVNAADIAIIHTVFNVLSTALLIPFAKQLEKLATITVKDSKTENAIPFIDLRFLDTPAIAKQQCLKNAAEMADLCKNAFIKSTELIFNYDEKKANEVLEMEKLSDMYEDMLGTYLVKLSSKDLNGSDSRDVSKMMLSIVDFERIGDHAANVVYSMKNMKEKKLKFSDQAISEFKVMCSALDEILNLAVNSFKENNLDMANKVEPLEQVIDRIFGKMRENHIERLKAGITTAEHGLIHSDLMNSFQRVSDHCSNIAVCVIQIDMKAFDTHEYLNDIRIHDDLFKKEYKEYKVKYALQ